MIGYVTIGTNQPEKAWAFFDELLGLMGAKRFMEAESFVAWMGPNPEACGLGVMKPFDGNAASVGNGVMVALQADGPDMVQKIHAKALALGGTDEGAPGYRDGSFYAGYFRDLDGNKFNAFCMQPAD